MNAVLLSYGVDAKDVRGLQHDLSKRLASAKDAGLKLGARTVMHIDKLTETQEYLKARYAPHESANLSPLNRLQQTLKEVREQALAIVDRSEAPVAVHKTSAGNK
ncbi:MAG: hypothetical protein HOP13_01920 [Alphaproteobacteria bacterium]|nr:hypothetical protein [Alphaproteobacteria bacterium]